MTRYLIDIRLMGPVKRQIRELSRGLEEKFRLGSKLAVPHITLAGPFCTDDEARLVADFAGVCSGVTGVPRYEAGGYGFFDGTRVVYVTISPDDTLRQFRYRLSRTLAPYCTLRDYDLDSAENFQFHATLAMKLDWLTYQRIRWHFRSQEPVVHRHHPVRATLLKNRKILCEYDFIQQRMLTRAQALGRATLQRDRAILRSWGEDDAW